MAKIYATTKDSKNTRKVNVSTQFSSLAPAGTVHILDKDRWLTQTKE